MSDLMEKTCAAQAIFDDSVAADCLVLLSEFKKNLTEKQLGVFEELMLKRESLIMRQDSDIHNFFKEFKGVAYLYPSSQKSGAWSSCGFTGNRSKPDFRYWFTSKEDAQAYIQKWAVAQIKKELDKKQKREEKKSQASRMREFVSIGDVFVSSWGWDQTNIDYYKVVGFSGESTLRLIRIGSHNTQRDGSMSMCGVKTPDIHTEIGEVFTKRAEVSESCMRNGKMEVSFNFSSYRGARLKPKLEDGTYSGDDYSFWA